MKEKAVSEAMLTLLLMGMLALAAVSIATSQVYTVLSVEPWVAEPELGDWFLVNITVTNITAFKAYAFKLWYNSTLINATDIVDGPILAARGADWFPAIPKPVALGTPGRVWYGGTLTALPTIDIPGTETLATINFTALEAGITTLHLNDTIIEIMPSPPTVIPQPHSTVDADVTVVASIEIPIEGGENATIRGNVTLTNIVATNNTLSFDASGPTGSTGWINVTFPMVNTTDIKVFIDGVELTPPPFPIITSNGTHYFIYFEFTLSTRSIDIQFAPTPVGGIYIPINKLELLAPYIGLAILLAVAVVTVVYVKKRKRNTEINS